MTEHTNIIKSLYEKSNQIAALCFLTLGSSFMTVMMLAAAMAPNYNLNPSAISDLGVIPETALLFNVGLILVGILNMVGGYFFYHSHRTSSLFVVSFVAGVGAIGTGLFPLNAGDIHSIFALLAFLFFNIQVLATSAQISNLPMKVISVLLGILGLIFVIIMIIGDSGTTAIFGPIGHGGAERMIVYPPMIWLMIFGGYLLSTDQ